MKPYKTQKLKSDLYIMSIIETKEQEVIQYIYEQTHWWDGEYNWYKQTYFHYETEPREVLTDEEWVEKHVEKLAKVNKVAVLANFMDEDEFEQLAEEEDFAY